MTEYIFSGMDGFKFFDEIRDYENIQNLPIIALNARAMRSDKEHLLTHGFNDCISKPVDISFFNDH